MIVLPLLLDLAGDIALPLRIEKLTPFFSPKPGAELRLSEDIPRKRFEDGKKSIDPLTQQGFIEVQSPKKSCLVLRRDDHAKDIRVCGGSKKRIPFQLQEIDDFGRIYMQVFSSDQDLGTQLYWTTPYRRAQVVDESMEWPGTGRVSFTKSCSFTSKTKERKLSIDTFEGLRWQISLPETDTPSKPDFERYQLNSDGTETKLDGPEKKAEEPDPSKDAHGDKPKAPPSAKRIVTVKKWKTNWYSTYDLSGKAIYSESATTSSDKGKCRYGYHNDTSEKDIGILECINVSNLKWFFVPVTCLKPQMNPNL